MTTPKQPTPETAAERTRRSAPELVRMCRRDDEPLDTIYRMAEEYLTDMLDRFAAQRAAEAVELEQHRLEAERQKILGDPRVGVHIPPADWGLPQNAPTPPPGDAGERARDLLIGGTHLCGHGHMAVMCRICPVEKERDEAIAALQSERTAAASQARRETMEIVTDVARRAAESAQVTPRQMDTIPTADEWKARQHYLHGKRHACAEIDSAIRALATPQESGGDA